MNKFSIFAPLSASVLILSTSHVWAQGTDDQAVIQHGAYLARTGDCVACHTAPGGKPFAGGLAISSPFGLIYSSNITPDATTGIGKWSEKEFVRALREGKRKDGSNLYPAMPYPSYAHISDADAHALYVYFMQGVKPVEQKTPKTDLSFPFNQRWGLSLWNWVFTGGKPFASTPSEDAPLQRGAYLVEGLGHCGSCHTPRGFADQEKALDGSSDQYLSGSSINGWWAPPLRGKGGGDNPSGIQGWSTDDIVNYLASGRNSHSAVAGEMISVIANSTSYMNKEDLTAIATYLKSLSGPEQTSGVSSTSAADTTRLLTDARNLNEGERLYLDNCVACHQVNGHGAGETIPSIAGSSIANASDATGLIRIILQGARMPSTPTRPEAIAMPDFGWRLDDDEVASLATFLRSGWGNKAGSVSASDVAKVRKSLPRMERSSAPQDVDGLPVSQNK